MMQIQDQTEIVGQTIRSDIVLGSFAPSDQDTPQSNVQDYENIWTDTQSDFLREIRMVARLRRARQLQLKTKAEFCLVLIEIEHQPLTPPVEWEEQSFMMEALKNQITNACFDGAFLYDAHKVVITREIERVILLWVSLREQGSWTGVSATIGQYLLSHFDGSVLLTLKQAFDDYFTCLEPHAGESWLELLKLSHSNWKLATQNDGFNHVTKALSMLIGAGMLQASSIQCEIAGIKLFSDLCVPKFVSAFDLLDATMNCIVFFVEGGYECITTGSITPLLFGERDFTSFDEVYLKCKKCYEYAHPGNYFMIDMDENDVMKLLSDSLAEGKRLAQLTKNSMSKKLIMDRVGKIQEWESNLQQHRLASGIRIKPYCVIAHGETGVGKSTIAPLIMYHILQPNGYDASDKSCVMLKAGQKHEENFRTYVNGIYYDDFSNTKPAFVQESPCEDLLDTVNTAKCTARMAALELKNKVSKHPKGVVVSTNVKTLKAEEYSEEPAAIIRRAEAVATFHVRPEFATNNMLDSKKVEDHYDGNVPHVPDLWTIDVEIGVPVKNPTPGRHATIGFKTIVWNGKPLKSVDVMTFLQYIVVSSRQHFIYQKALVERGTDLKSKMVLCPSCKSSTAVCVCGLTHSISYESSAPAGKAVPSMFKVRKGYCACTRCMGARKEADCPYKPTRASVAEMEFEETLRANPKYSNLKKKALEEQAFKDTALHFVDKLTTLHKFQFKWIVPQRFVRHYAVLSVLQLFLKHPSARYHVLFGFTLPLFVQNRFLLLMVLLGYLYFLYVVFMSYVSIVEERVAEQKQSAWHTTKHYAQRTAVILGTGVAVKIIYDMTRAYFSARSLREPFKEQGYMSPTDAQIIERDANDVTAEIAVEHNWATVELQPLPASEQSKTIREDDLVNLCARNTAALLHDGKLVTNMFFIQSNVALLPTHLIKKWRDKLCTVVRSDVSAIGGNFKCYLSESHSAHIPNTDVSLVWIPNGGSWKNLSGYFPTQQLKEDFGMRMCTRNIVGENVFYRSFAKFSPAEKLVSCTASGYMYSVDSYLGMCGSPVIAQKIAPMIMGVHVAGVVEQKLGFASSVMQSDLEYALGVLSEKPSVLLGHSTGTLPAKIYDKSVLDEQAVHFKSPVNKLEIDETDNTTPNMVVYGSCAGRASYYSKVVTSHASFAVTAVCGIAQKWGKPKFGKGSPWLESLKFSSKPSCGVEPSLLDKAVKDYLKPLFILLNERPSVKAEIKPLSKMETVCGIDGRKFVDKMKPNTAVGYPLTGPKSNYITLLDPNDFEGFSCPAELDSIFWDEFGVAIEAWSSGNRYHPVFKACLKDEPTPLDKDKVRVFQAAPIVLQLAVRKYFLPIVRFVSLFPELTECAVGLNCMGPDWEEFQAHIKKFGDDRILAGDYSKYDLRMPAQLIMAAFKSLIAIAKLCNYSDVDIEIMTGIATDIAYPTIAFNGDLLQFVGSNPSGQNLTVYINSIVNSLLFRCAFFHLTTQEDFRKVCALGTYGDDAKGSVKVGHDEFNHISVANFFAERDMKFTMPDKKSTPTPYMKDADADFLKRKNVFIPELGLHCGALDEESIFKSLHANLKSKRLTKQELSATCIDGAIREWFFHGRETYVKRQTQMRDVAELAEISNLCKMLSVSYDDRVKSWNGRYGFDDMDTDMESL